MVYEQSERLKCLAGYSALCLAFGLFSIVPATILFALYLNDTTYLQTVYILMFVFGMLFCITGLSMCIVWCRKSKYMKSNPEEAKPALANNNTANGNLQSDPPDAGEDNPAMSA